MKKSEYEKFQTFKKQHKITDKQIAKIMTDYANTTDEYAASFFASKYNISQHTFYRIRDFCIIFMLVEAPICQRIRDKSLRNQSKRNSSGNCTSSNKYYKSLIKKRKEYLFSFSCEEISEIATQYANGDAIYDIAKKHKISPYTVRKLLVIALTNHLVCESVYQKIKLRSQLYISQLRYFSGYTAEELWNVYSH